jgi:hypothetical protein
MLKIDVREIEGAVMKTAIDEVSSIFSDILIRISSMTYHRISDKSNTTGSISGAETATKEISFGNAYILAQLSGLTSLCVFF